MDKTDIRNLRWDMQLSQAKFALLLGVCRDCVSLWERGARRPSGLSVVKIKKLAAQNQKKGK